MRPENPQHALHRTMCNLVSKSEFVKIKTLRATWKHQETVHMTLRIRYERSEKISFKNWYVSLIGLAPPSGGPPCAPVYIWGKKSSSTPDLGDNYAFWGFASVYVSKCRNITRCHRNMVDSAFKSWWSILSEPNKIFVIRTHSEELHALKCISSTDLSTNFSQQ